MKHELCVKKLLGVYYFLQNGDTNQKCCFIYVYLNAWKLLEKL